MWSVIVGSFLFSVCASESLIADTAVVARVKRQHPGQAQHQQQAPLQSISYRPYQEAPDRIKQLLHLQQAREPLVHLPAASPPQLQQLQGGGQHGSAPAPQAPQHSPAAQPTQYNPNVQYGQAPQQPTYKGIQPGPLPQHRAPQLPAQNAYTPQYKSQYNGPQQQPNPNSIYRSPAPAGPPQGQYQGQYQGQASGSFPKNLPPHIQKIIESQRSYQG